MYMIFTSTLNLCLFLLYLTDKLLQFLQHQLFLQPIRQKEHQLLNAK